MVGEQRSALLDFSRSFLEEALLTVRIGTVLRTVALAAVAIPVLPQTLVNQPYQTPDKCLPCHQRQYDELRSSVKSGYRSHSPLMNSLEVSGNFLGGGLLRPVYGDSTKVVNGVPLTTNHFTTPTFTQTRQMQAGFCFSCHAPHVLAAGEDPARREVPELPGNLPADFRPDLLRPLRDYHFVDPTTGRQVLPDEVGGLPPEGSRPSLGGYAVSCDVCHNVTGPDIDRSLQRDGFANVSVKLSENVVKVGPFPFPVASKGNFHQSSNDPERIAFLRSSALCHSCHDVRVPAGAPGDLQHKESNLLPDGSRGAVTPYRLENLSTEWQVGAYNSANNPFGAVVRCQDCHMSQYPYTEAVSYTVGGMNVTSPRPGVFAENFAAVPGVSTAGDFPLSRRVVTNHNFTGVDVPLMSGEELKARLGTDYPDPHAEGTDEYGHPKALSARREALLKAAVRIDLAKSDTRAKIGEDFAVRLQAVSLTGHRFPSGFSQERTAYVHLTVKDANDFVVYQSGYLVDKPHPETGETEPDGNLDDEDLEHIRAVIDPGRPVAERTPPQYAGGAGVDNGHTNQVFDPGPDEGPDFRVYAGIPRGLVLFRNELLRVFLPGNLTGRTGADGTPVRATKPHFEETFSAGFANSVDNFRALQPLVPRTFDYMIKLPSAEQLHELDVTLQGPLKVHAEVNFAHFPPLFIRFLARTTGPNGPGGRDMNLVKEETIDRYLKNVTSIASADFEIDLEQ